MPGERIAGASRLSLDRFDVSVVEMLGFEGCDVVD